MVAIRGHSEQIPAALRGIPSRFGMAHEVHALGRRAAARCAAVRRHVELRQRRPRSQSLYTSYGTKLRAPCTPHRPAGHAHHELHTTTQTCRPPEGADISTSCGRAGGKHQPNNLFPPSAVHGMHPHHTRRSPLRLGASATACHGVVRGADSATTRGSCRRAGRAQRNL